MKEDPGAVIKMSEDERDSALKMVDEMEKRGIEMVKDFTGEKLS